MRAWASYAPLLLVACRFTYAELAPFPCAEGDACPPALTCHQGQCLASCPSTGCINNVITGGVEVEIASQPQRDILFVIDNSGSMAEEIARVRTSMVAMIERLSQNGNDFRIAFTTTDNREATGCSDLTGLPAGVDSVFNGRCGRFLAPKGSPGWIDARSYSIPSVMASAIAPYLDPSVAEVSGSAVEQPMKSVQRAIDESIINKDFFRGEAQLLVVIVTDESDCSFADEMSSTFSGGTVPGASCYTSAASLKTAAAWAFDLGQEGTFDHVRVGLISGAVLDATGKAQPAACRITSNQPTDACACFYKNPLNYCPYTKLSTPTVTEMPGAMTVCGTPTDEGNCCTALANNRLFEYADSFLSYKDTICQSDYSAAMRKLAELADAQCFRFTGEVATLQPTQLRVRLKRALESTFSEVPRVTSSSENGWYPALAGGKQMGCLAGTYRVTGTATLHLSAAAR